MMNFVTHGKTMIITVLKNGAGERSGRHPGIAFEVSEDAPDRFHRDATRSTASSTSSSCAPGDSTRDAATSWRLRFDADRADIHFARATITSAITVSRREIFRSSKQTSIECVAGHGIRGDRFFRLPGRITRDRSLSFRAEVFDRMRAALGVTDEIAGRAAAQRDRFRRRFEGVDRRGFRAAGRAVPRHGALQALLLDEHRLRARRGEISRRQAADCAHES